MSFASRGGEAGLCPAETERGKAWKPSQGFHIRGTTLVVLLLSEAAQAAFAGGVTEITFDKALELARAQSPEAQAARMRVDEARGRAISASVLLRDNPRVGISMGRWFGESSGLAADADVSQTFELGGRRAARIAGSQAALDRATASGEAVARSVLREAAASFHRALYAQARLKLAARAEELAQATLLIAERRYRAGDVPKLHASLAGAALARARSERRACEGVLARASGGLLAVLGLGKDASIVVVGDLSNRRAFDRIAAETVGWEERPEIRQLEAEAREAAGDLRLGQGLRWPELGLGVRFAQEEPGIRAALGTLTLSLPIFDRGQGARAEAQARERRVRFELDSARRRIGVEAATALAVFRKQVEALTEIESTVPIQEENEALARRSYETGQLGLGDLLLVRREVLETQLEFLSRQLDVAMAGIELAFATGALQ
jgi:outer membrane protein, heavy metal efflux system